MKRRTFAIILLCVGIAGLLLPWKYTLFENERYCIEQTPTGGIITVHDFDALHRFPWDYISYGVSAFSMEEVVEKLLSGDVLDSQLAFVSSEPKERFLGMDKLYVPKMPSGYSISPRQQWWSVEGFHFSIKNKERNISGNMFLCTGSERCWDCGYFDKKYQSGSDDDSVECYRLIDGSKVIRNGDRIRLKGSDNGLTVHLELWCQSEPVSDFELLRFGARRYFSTHPKMLMVYAINAGHWLGIIAITVGIALLPKENLRRKKKTATAE